MSGLRWTVMKVENLTDNDILMHAQGIAESESDDEGWEG